MRIVHISGIEKKGGRASFLIDLMLKQSEEGLDVYLVTTSDSWVKEEALIRKIPVLVIKKPSLAKLAKNKQIPAGSVIHYHDSAVYKYIPKQDAVRKAGIMTIADVHDYDWKIKSFPFTKYLERLDRVIAASNYEKSLSRDIPMLGNQIDVIPKPVYLKRFAVEASPQPVLSRLSVPPEISLIGTVSRFDETLNYELLIATMKLCVANHDDIEFLLIGDGPMKEEFIKRINNEGLTAKTLMTGFQDNIAQYYAAIDIYFHCTFMDMLSFSVVEAIAMGKPIIAPNLSTIREIMTNNVHGLFYNVESPDSAYELIVELRGNPDLQKKIRENNCELAKKKFSLDVVSKDYTRIYKKMIDSLTKA
ncbi:MAG: glycosyltransferase family 4 protein [Acidobacteria bacterium]|nr:glycosyltransferase family 4 protein [Acidobacteriota bacterium]